MPRVNLLPWREELRKQRQQSFLLATMGAVLLGGILVLGTNAYFKRQVANQQDRNTFLADEIKILDGQIDSKRCSAHALKLCICLMSWSRPCPRACILNR